MYTKLSVTLCSMALITGLTASAAPAEAAPTPSKINSVRAVAGPGAGQVTISWNQDGRNTSAFKIETGLTSFSKTSTSMPRSGRNAKVFMVSRSKRSVTLSAAQMASAGAGVGTAHHLYFRVFAVNGSATRAYPYLQARMPKAAAPKAKGTPIRVGSYNVRTARATGDARSWLRRAPDVAREIRDRNPGVVAIQELGPGRADGRTGTTNGGARQTTSLTSALRSVGAGRYHLVRTTPYVKPGSPHGTQGARILYDVNRYSLLSRCSDKTGKSSYSSTCSLELPRLGSESKNAQRSAAYAQFRDRRTGKRFWLASVHLDERHSTNTTTEKSYNALRARQMSVVNSKIRSLNSGGDQVFIAGDINSWQNSRGGYAPHDYLVSQGYYDTAAALIRVNTRYSTINHFDRTLKPAAQGYGVRLDVIMVKGVTGSRRFENVTTRVDSSRPSDHNLVISDVVL